MKKTISNIVKRWKNYLKRRPHRSFRITKRRDYIRPLVLPGYLSLTKEVLMVLLRNKKLFLLLTTFYAVLTFILVGLASQDNYTLLVETMKQTSGDMFNGFWGEIGGAGLMFITAVTGGLSPSLTDVQQVYAGLLMIMVWLATVWLLRNIMAGHKVNLRDGLYNSGAPLLPMFMVSLLLIIQLLPLALALIAYSAAISTGFLDGGVEAMLFWVVAGLLFSLSLYWMISTFFAMIIVTLPGMYPMQAIKIAGDMLSGRRLKVLLRIVWLVIVILLAWALVLIPIILFNNWLNAIWPAISWLPIIPISILILSSITMVWVASYIYILYRKVVDNDAN